MCVILAEVPLATMFDYANELRSMTQGKGTFTMEFFRYKQVPDSRCRTKSSPAARPRRKSRLAVRKLKQWPIEAAANRVRSFGLLASFTIAVCTIAAAVLIGRLHAVAPSVGPPLNSASSRPIAAPVTTERPAVEILSWDQTEKRLADFHGKVVVLDVWSTYCDPCVREFPNLVALQKRFGDKVRCISFDTDYSGAVREPAESFRKPVLEFLSKHGAAGLLNVISSDAVEDFYNKIRSGRAAGGLRLRRERQTRKRFDNSQIPNTGVHVLARYRAARGKALGRCRVTGQVRDENPLPARLAIGSGWREADVSPPARPHGDQSGPARRGFRRGRSDCSVRVRSAPARRDRRLESRRCRRDDDSIRREAARAALPGVAAFRRGQHVKAGTTILHSRADDVIPYADSEELIRKSGLPPPH